MKRQLAEQEGREEQEQDGECPLVVTAGSASVRLSPPSNSKLAARRRQRSSLLKGAPVSASELRQLLAPLVIMGDCA